MDEEKDASEAVEYLLSRFLASHVYSTLITLKADIICRFDIRIGCASEIPGLEFPSVLSIQ